MWSPSARSISWAPTGSAVIHASEEGVDDLFGFILAEILDEAIEDVLTGHGVIDLGLFVVVLQFGEVDDAVLARVLGLFINLEHYLVGFKQHIALFYGNGGGIGRLARRL